MAEASFPQSEAAVDSEARTIFVAHAHRDGKRFVVRADEKPTAFLELESVIHRRKFCATL
jgi:hypothetical protein